MPYVIELEGYGDSEKSHRMYDINIDQYNNMYCKFDGMIPVAYLPKFGRILYELLEYPRSFRGRTVISLYIQYFRRFHNELTESDLRDMLRHEFDSVDGSFREWLIGTSYSSDGNVPHGYKYSKKELKRLADG